MVYGEICLGTRTELVVVNEGLPYRRKLFANARPHKYRCVSNFLNVVGTMAWPACSPDINPIEHVCRGPG